MRKKGLGREKFWFQTEQDFLKSHSKEELKSTLVVVITRSPYEWVLSMQKQPLHAVNHFNLNWKRFVSRPWLMKTSSQDIAISATTGAQCQEHFENGGVIPCRSGDSVVLSILSKTRAKLGYPVYETHIKDKRPFKNVAELRRAKMLNYFNLSSWVDNVEFVKSERLFELREFNSFLERLNEDYGIGVCLKKEGKVKWKEIIETVTMEEYERFERMMPGRNKTKVKKKKSIPKGVAENFGFLRWLTCNVHWRIEARFGYKKIKSFLFDHSSQKRIRCSKNAFEERFRNL